MKIFCILFLTTLMFGSHRYSGETKKRHAELAKKLAAEDLQVRTITEDTLTGDWHGKRAELVKRGISFTSEYETDFLGNPIGGQARGFAYTGSLGTDCKVDLEQTIGMDGWVFYTDVVWRKGNSLSADKIGNQFPVQQVYGGQTMQLNRLLFQYTTPGERFSLKFGRLNAGNNFLQSDWYYYFVSNAFCGNPVGIFFNDPGFTAYPHATWGVVAEGRPWEPVRIQVGVYNGNSTLQRSKYHGLNFTFDTVQGPQCIGEVTFELNKDKRYPGNYSVGVFTFAKRTQQFLGSSSGDDPGWYVMVDQTICHFDPNNKKIGITPFGAFLFTPENRNILPFFMTAGAVYNGAFTGNAEDALCAGIAYGKYSSDSNEANGGAGQNFEMVYEINYKYNPTGWFFVQPDLQYIVKPKGFSSIRNALAIGAQVAIVF